MQMKLIIGLAVLISLIGCAASPSSIQPAAVSRVGYINMSCENLSLQMAQEISNLENLTGEQLSSRNWDIALNILLIPGIGALTGDQEEAIAQSKGRMVVMQDEYATKCGK